MAGAGYHRGSSRQDYSTPLEFIDAVEKRFGSLSWDLAASATNAKAPHWIGQETDSLSQQWHRRSGLLWLNPPFSHIRPWAKKCFEESLSGARILFLVPASVGSEWFASYVHGAAFVLPLRPRLSFDGKHPFPKDLMLCAYLSLPGFAPWRWK